VTIPLALCVQLATAVAVGAGLVAACRWLRRRSSLCASVVAAGLLLRAAVLLILFWTSYLDLPILQSLHSGDGFWKLAIDAPVYHQAAVKAATEGLGTVHSGSPSPAFVKTLGLWMRAAGSSPISGGYLNLALYVLLCVIVVAAFRPTGNWRTDLPCAAMLCALSFSPVLVVYGSQPLKDTMFVCLIGMLCVAARGFLPSLTLIHAAVFLAALYVMAGIRGYYAAIAWSALASVLFAVAWRERGLRFVRHAAVSILFLTGAWLTYMAGADRDYINPYRTAIMRLWPPGQPAPPGTAAAAAVPKQAPVLTEIDGYRAGFVQTHGATNVNSPRPPARPPAGPGTAATPTTAPSPVPEDVKGRLSAVAMGLGLIFVPVSVLKALSIVDFSGGRGLLALTDVDTVFMDVMIVAAIAFVVRRRSSARGALPYVCFAAILGVAAALLMAYVVTNFGTLFRLRLMAAAPLWMLPLALGRGPVPASGARSAPPPSTGGG
jgi:hypothetical protein